MGKFIKEANPYIPHVTFHFIRKEHDEDDKYRRNCKKCSRKAKDGSIYCP